MCTDIVKDTEIIYSVESEFECLGITIPIKFEISIGKVDEIDALYDALTTEEEKTAFSNLLVKNASNAMKSAMQQEHENREENMDPNEERRDSNEKKCDPMAQREE